MKLSKPARISFGSQVAKICLPFADLSFSSLYTNPNYDDIDINYGSVYNNRDNNNLRNFRQGRRSMIRNLPKNARQMVTQLLNKSITNGKRKGRKIGRRRNDKFASNLFSGKRLYTNQWNRDIQMEVRMPTILFSS